VVTILDRSWTQWPEVAPDWSALVLASPYLSAFLTSAWVEAWLSVFGDSLAPRVLVFRSTSAPQTTVGACVLVARAERRGPFSLRQVHFHTAGEDEADETVPEHNAVLCLEGWEREVAAALRGYLDRSPWDQFIAGGMAEGPTLDAVAEAFADIPAIVRPAPSHYIDLASLDADGYLARLSRNTREQIRRSRRLYEHEGPVTLEQAADLPAALAMLDELAGLHQTAWEARGEAGVFSSPLFVAFHRAFIERAFASGGVQLLRVRVGPVAIAILYNLVHAGRVSSYQSGLRYSHDNRLKPGVVAHVLAMEHCRASGFTEYDLLSGGSQYKKSLATGSRTLTWMTFQRATMKLKTLDRLAALKRSARARIRRTPVPPGS
jgi:CelD/BcsL family acetyltransferase involved in cellulose biosynthesis